jgi:hypothetical protein
MNATFEVDTPAAPAMMTLTVAHADVNDLHNHNHALDPTKLVGMLMIIRYSLSTS